VAALRLKPTAVSGRLNCVDPFRSLLFRLALAAMMMAALSTAPLHAQQEESGFATALVPVVGAVTGVGQVRWRAAVTITNRLPRQVDVILTMPTAPGEPFLMTSLAPGQQLVYRDISREAFGRENLVAPLLIHTLDRFSVQINAVIEGDGPDGPVQSQPLSTVYGLRFGPVVALPGLASTDEHRTNVGLVNLGESEATFTMVLQRLEGRNLALQRITLPPQTIIHISLQAIFPLLSEADRLTLLCESIGENAYIFASVLRNDDHSGIVIGP
jgi:hypothetical protein